MKPLILFSRPIRSGKTTELEHWCAKQRSVGGFLTPDRDSIRMLLCLRDNRLLPFELNAGTSESFTQIGRFLFSDAAFETGREALLRDAIDLDFLIVDEIGKLEMKQQKGWERAFQELLSLWRAGKVKGQIIVVVRDFLLDEFVNYYKPESYTVIHQLSDSNELR